MLEIDGLESVQMRTARRDGTKGVKYYDSGVLVGKDCAMCRKPLPLESYKSVSTKTSRDGRASRCVVCTQAEQAGFRAKYSNDPTKDPSKYSKRNSARTPQEVAEAITKHHPTGLKRCPGCGEDKPVKRFQRNRSNNDGLNHQCAKCANQARKCKGNPKDVQARKYPDGTKTCPSCRTTKSLSQFYNNRARHDGLHRNCRSCDSTHMRNKRREAYESHWRTNNIPFECYVCQGPYEQSDHVYPAILGGPDTPDNRLPMCAHHNGSKNGTPLIEWLSTYHRGTMDEVLHRVIDVYGVNPDPTSSPDLEESDII